MFFEGDRIDAMREMILAEKTDDRKAALAKLLPYQREDFIGIFKALDGMTKAPERWEASWDNNVKAAQLSDEAGLEFILPVGRWHGYRGETDTEGTSFETLTWASGLLASTLELCVFGTLHVAFINPVFAAKQIVTADHIGKGRFGLNIVSGWNAGEFDMELQKTPAYGELIHRIWSSLRDEVQRARQQEATKDIES